MNRREYIYIYKEEKERFGKDDRKIPLFYKEEKKRVTKIESFFTIIRREYIYPHYYFFIK